MNEDELQKIDNEWRALKHINLSFVQDTEEFWKGIGKISQADDTPAFPKLSKFVFETFSLQHSSANTERIFSEVNMVKTKLRNSLETDTLNGLLHAKHMIKNQACYKFNVPIELLNRYFKNIYNKDL